MNFPKIPIWLLVIIGIVGVFAILVLSGRITWFSTEPPLQVLPNMDLNFKAIPQSGNAFFANRSSLREPVPGTVARNVAVYPLGPGDIDAAETLNVDPELKQTEFVLARGQNRFNVFCAPCHDYNAHSESAVVKRGQWAGIPDLHREETVALSNARLFHIISAGQNLMPSYADKISPVDRWTIVYYLRTLQHNASKGE
ncbi:MAG: cytochrome c [Chlorobi bacterium]|nr:MAG: cytochrome c [Bacteroidota bacterium]KXK33212.1 MAG: alternative complex III protein ActDE [Chlorobi bacterium OLB6]MBE2265660.1 cytochrome c [Flavobacteriales bacterium]MBL1160402.1 cytochrome c [Chlorobiota bacterium]MBW7853547.1 cytochrome c [Candidatus Kapabacteria bacterium]MCC6331160.1 cytochrome c [Ignavibacteria bacterium]